ncbi:hypothetical protein ACIG47_11140 [Promicromonospora sp. NPDC052451]|uniref:hypothetical protein n=1 Tax=Promicromonospora sp. NPDC052451 TaxID=3364407 RepID=UPI0037C6CB90
MSPPRRLRALLAGPGPGSAGVLSVLFLVLAVLGGPVVCGIHSDEHPQAHHGSAVEAASGPAGGLAPADRAEPTSDGGEAHCSDHGRATAQTDPVVSSSGPAAVAEPAVQGIAPALAYPDHRTAPGVVRPAAPSLHALGICRT